MVKCVAGHQVYDMEFLKAATEYLTAARNLRQILDSG